jgi:protein O-GlcNAc transferase
MHVAAEAALATPQVGLTPRCQTLNNLGNVLRALGDEAGAISYYRRTVEACPTFAAPHCNLAAIFATQHDFEAAEAELQAVIDAANAPEASPNLVTASGVAASMLAGIKQRLGDTHAAADLLSFSCRVRPQDPSPHLELAETYVKLAEPSKAVALLETAIELAAHAGPAGEQAMVRAHSLKGDIARADGRYGDALAAYKAALARNPTDAAPLLNALGAVSRLAGKPADAQAYLEQSLKADPTFAAAHSNLGTLLRDWGRRREALEHYLSAIQLDPELAEAYSNVGNFLREQGNYQKAYSYYQKALQLRPDFLDARLNRAGLLKDLNHYDRALADYRYILTIKPGQADALANLVHLEHILVLWDDRQRHLRDLVELTERQLRAGELPSVQPFQTMIYPLSARLSRAVAAAYARQAAVRALDAAVDPFEHHLRRPGEPLHVGLVSSEFGNQPLAQLLSGLVGRHDRSRIRLHGFSLGPSDQTLFRRHLEVSFDAFSDLSALSAAESATRIHAEGIHVLLNLNGHSRSGNMDIFSLRPAPIQVSYLGFASTTGADYVDYIITDRIASPPDHAHAYTEQLCYMPKTYFSCDHPRLCAHAVLQPELAEIVGDVPSSDLPETVHVGDGVELPAGRAALRAHYGLPVDGLLLVNFNQLYKLDPTTFRLWVQILRALPAATLVLLRFPAGAEAQLLRYADMLEVERGRIVFLDVAERDEHVRRGLIGDVFLDTPLCNGHTTVADALWTCLPVVTFPGEKMASRVAASMLHAAGCGELVASSFRDYFDIAVRLARDVEFRNSIRRRLSDARVAPGGLFDAGARMTELSAAFEQMYRNYEEGSLPATFDVKL